MEPKCYTEDEIQHCILILIFNLLYIPKHQLKKQEEAKQTKNLRRKKHHKQVLLGEALSCQLRFMDLKNSCDFWSQTGQRYFGGPRGATVKPLVFHGIFFYCVLGAKGRYPNQLLRKTRGFPPLHISNKVF